MFNLVTPCTRQENLKHIYNSILTQSYNDFTNICWWIVFDESVRHFEAYPSDDVPILEDRLRIIQINKAVLGSTAGHGQRNHVLDRIPSDEWFYSVDDDNILHPDFLSTVSEVIKKDSEIKAIVVSQNTRQGSCRLHAAPENTRLFHIDTAQYIFKKEIVSQPFDVSNYNADGIFIEQLYKKHPDKFHFIDIPLCYYNYLRD